MTRISAIDALQVLDGRGDPTLEVHVILESGLSASAIAPAGKSKGKDEALELRDGDEAFFHGKGVNRAAKNVVDLIAPELKGMDVQDQAAIDQKLIGIDGSSNFSTLGSNAVVGVSIACARASAIAAGIPLFASINPDGHYLLPMPQISIIGGGLHADNPLEIQDFLVIPTGANSFSEAVHMAWNVRTAAGELVREMGHPLLVGDGGGFAPPFRKNQLALELVVKAIEHAGYIPGEDLALAMDVAANHLTSGEGYQLDGKWITRADFIDVLQSWVEVYPIVSIEDPFDEDDNESWADLTARAGGSVQFVGDDLFVTNAHKLAEGLESGLGNAILVKPNQVGTLTQTLAVIHQAQEAGFGTVVSIRSGESEDAFIADLAVAAGAGQIKLGSLARASRTAKFNTLLRIEHRHGERIPFAGKAVLQDLLPNSRWL